jgi:hypothetical protein
MTFTTSTAGNGRVTGNSTVDGTVTATNIVTTGNIDGRDVSADGAALDLISNTIGLKNLTASEVTQLAAIDTTTISATQWGYVGSADQALKTTDSPTFASIMMTGLTGTNNFLMVDGLADAMSFKVDSTPYLTFNTSGSGSMVFNKNVTVAANLIVTGSTTTVTSENVLIADNHLTLNSGYTAATAQSGGLTVNYLPTSTSDTGSVFVAGIAATSNPTLVTVGESVFSAGDIILISNTKTNNGIYEVKSHTSNLLTINGVGTVATTEDFSNNQFSAGTAFAILTKINVAILQADISGEWVMGKGSTTPITKNRINITANKNYNRTEVTGSSYSILDTDHIVAVKYTATGAVTLTLPAISSLSGGKLCVKIVDEGANASVNNITINRSGSDTILGSDTSYTMSENAKTITMYSDGTSKWFMA